MQNTLVAALLLLASISATSAQAQSPVPVAGKDYIEIPGGTPLVPVEGKIVIEEFFNYICPACNQLEPQLVAWTAQLPPYAKLQYVPATFREDFAIYARAYYAAEALNLVDKTHAAVFEAIHRSHQLPAEGQKPDPERIAKFYAKYGVEEKDFLAMMKSFAVDAKVRRASDYMKRVKLEGTPSLVVNGRYMVTGSSFTNMLDIAKYLVEKEHKQ